MDYPPPFKSDWKITVIGILLIIMTVANCQIKTTEAKYGKKDCEKESNKVVVLSPTEDK